MILSPGSYTSTDGNTEFPTMLAPSMLMAPLFETPAPIAAAFLAMVVVPEMLMAPALRTPPPKTIAKLLAMVVAPEMVMVPPVYGTQSSQSADPALETPPPHAAMLSTIVTPKRVVFPSFEIPPPPLLRGTPA